MRGDGEENIESFSVRGDEGVKIRPTIILTFFTRNYWNFLTKRWSFKGDIDQKKDFFYISYQEVYYLWDFLHNHNISEHFSQKTTHFFYLYVNVAKDTDKIGKHES